MKRRPSFSSTLGAAEALSVREAGLTPLRLVMGTAFHTMGVRGMPIGTSALGRAIELRAPSDAWNDAWRNALTRLRDEAREAGADAVVGVRIERGVRAVSGAGLVEVTLIGTAVRSAATQLGRGDAPALCTLSGQDVAKLARHGFLPRGVVAGATVVNVVAGMEQLAQTRGMVSSRANRELPDFTRGLYVARELVMTRITEQAQALGADGVVGVKLERVEHRRAEEDGGKSAYLVLELHVHGTAVVSDGAAGRRTGPDLILETS